MARPPAGSSRLVNWVRLTARVVASLMAAFIFLLAIGEGFNPTKLTLEEWVMMLGFFAAWVGFILGWRWEGIGGILILGGLAWHCLFEYIFRGTMFLGFWVAVPALPGILFLICRWRTRAAHPVSGTEDSGAPTEHTAIGGDNQRGDKQGPTA